MIAAERIHVAVIEAARSQSEDEEDRGALFQQPGQERRGRRFLCVRSIRRDDRFAELRGKASLGELERQEPTSARQFPEIRPCLADARRAGYPGGDVLGGAEVLLEREPKCRQVRVEGEGDGRRPRDGPAVGFCETRWVVRIVEPDRHADAGFEHKKICVEDFSAPTLDQVDDFVAFVDSKIAEGKKVLVHCFAGRGRTGTMLAAYLIHKGMSAEAAVREIRERAGKAYGTLRGVIEPNQEELLHWYERRFSGR